MFIVVLINYIVSGTKLQFHTTKTPDRKPSAAGITDTPSGSSSKTDSTEHLVRLRQKLHQLRSLPSTSCDFSEQRIAVSIESPPPAATSNDPDQDEPLDIIYERRSSAAASKDNPRKPLELQLLGEQLFIIKKKKINNQ